MGIQQSPGWIHYMLHKPGMTIVYFNFLLRFAFYQFFFLRNGIESNFFGLILRMFRDLYEIIV